MGLGFLLHERFDTRLFGLHDLFDLGLLVIGEIERVQGEPHAGSHKPAVHSHAMVVHLAAFSLGEGKAGSKRQRENAKYCNLRGLGFHNVLLMV
jgi:hypothetical protein